MLLPMKMSGKIDKEGCLAIMMFCKPQFQATSSKMTMTRISLEIRAHSGLDVPAPIVRARTFGFGGLCLLWHQFWSALTAPEWRLAEQTADRAYKRVTVRE